jgi:hypothetical protein
MTVGMHGTGRKNEPLGNRFREDVVLEQNMVKPFLMEGRNLRG